MKEDKIQVLFPEEVETITISKNDYDKLYGEMTYKNIELQERIDKALEKINQYEVITGYYDSNYDGEEDTYSHDNLKEDLLNILQGKDENK